jgi:choline monooxygenase
VEFRYFHAQVGSAEAHRLIAEDVAYSDRVQQEDLDICAHVQKGIASRAYERGRFSVETEQCVHHFQEQLRGAYRSGVG